MDVDISPSIIINATHASNESMSKASNDDEISRPSELFRSVEMNAGDQIMRKEPNKVMDVDISPQIINECNECKQ